jgi:hypothetical protein
VEREPGLRRALEKWAAEYPIPWGYYEGARLGEVPLAWINSWLVPYCVPFSRHLKVLGIALKYHLPTRKPEIPGSKWVFTFGKPIGKTWDDVFQEEQNERFGQSYLEWLLEGAPDCIPCKPGWEDLAESIIIVWQHRMEALEREYAGSYSQAYRRVRGVPHPSTYSFRDENYIPVRSITDLSMEEVFKLEEQPRLGDMLWMALQWRILVHKLSRWNWRGTFEDRLGERGLGARRPW